MCLSSVSPIPRHLKTGVRAGYIVRKKAKGGGLLPLFHTTDDPKQKAYRPGEWYTASPKGRSMVGRTASGRAKTYEPAFHVFLSRGNALDYAASRSAYVVVSCYYQQPIAFGKQGGRSVIVARMIQHTFDRWQIRKSAS